MYSFYSRIITFCICESVAKICRREMFDRNCVRIVWLRTMIAVFTCENAHTKVIESCFITGYCKQVTTNEFAFKTVDPTYFTHGLVYYT